MGSMKTSLKSASKRQRNACLNYVPRLTNSAPASEILEIAKKMKFFDILGRIPTPPAPIEVKFCTAKRTQAPVDHAKFDVNRCNE